MPEKTYCGPKDPIPKGYKKRGSMTECASRRGGVMYYGVRQIDPTILKEGFKKVIKPPTSNQIFLKIAGATGAKNRLEDSVKYEKDPTKKAALQAELKENNTKLRNLKIEYLKTVEMEKNGKSSSRAMR